MKLICLSISLSIYLLTLQEESNWPLEEGKKVKERFDEIFNSAKYKDCLNSIKGNHQRPNRVFSYSGSANFRLELIEPSAREV